MKPEFKDKVIFITGSSQGIGRALAFYMGQRGAKIGLNGRDAGKLAKTHEELNSHGIDNLMIPGDVTDYETCQKIIGSLVGKYGRLDAIVANASVMVESTILEINPQVFRKAIDSQILGAVYPVKAALPELIKSKGYILLISSLSAFYGLPRFSAYSMGKSAHTAFAQSLGFELRELKVDVGIAYVCFTQNDPNKQMMLPDGTITALPKRPARMQHTQEKVARELAMMIKRKTKRKVLSFYGKAYDLSCRVFPVVTRTFIKRSLPI